MPAITYRTAMKLDGVVFTPETLDASTDTFTYKTNKAALLVFVNTTGASRTVNILGDEVTTAKIPGVGAVDISGGYDMTVGNGKMGVISLGAISEYLEGTIAITGSVGLLATILEL